jgi:hypothetical protein
MSARQVWQTGDQRTCEQFEPLFFSPSFRVSCQPAHGGSPVENGATYIAALLTLIGIVTGHPITSAT